MGWVVRIVRMGRRKLKLTIVVGARPNFVKIAPLLRQIARHPSRFAPTLVHTGQHYDRAMSADIFEDLGLPEPDINLGIGSGTHAEQVGQTMIELEKIIQQAKPDFVVVAGDVNAVCAAALTASKAGAKLAHIEAGLRSFDRSMPEEINRIVADALSDLLFTTDHFADANLLKEGRPQQAIHRVGNIMIDTLEMNRASAASISASEIIHRKLQSVSVNAPYFPEEGYAVLTLHRPSNVDKSDVIAGILDTIKRAIGSHIPLVWPIHPRTRENLKRFSMWKRLQNANWLVLTSPLTYREMLRLTMRARVVITDSGGLQEECCVLGTPCVVLRNTTERPITLKDNGGTCVLAGNSPPAIAQAVDRALTNVRSPSRPPLWDGHSAERIVEVFLNLG